MLTNEMIAALFNAIDSKLAAAEPLTIEDLELMQRLVQARVALEAMSAPRT
jgi:hypothetical protein